MGDMPVDLEALARWMDRQGLGKGPLEEAALLGGGTQNILLRFTRDGRSYVLRRPPPHRSRSTLRSCSWSLQECEGTLTYW